MATKYWNLKLEREIISKEDSIFHDPVNKEISLRKIGDDGKFSPDGTYPISGIVEFRNWKANAITSLYAFETEEEHKLDNYDAKETFIKYQISEDEGVTWKFWNGSNWINVSNDNDWNTVEEIDERINLFQFSGIRQLKLKAKLYSSPDNKFTPILKNEIALHHELKFNWMEDIKRTLKHYIENKLSFPLLYRIQLSGSTDTFEIATDFEVSSVEAIFNLYDDPYRHNNIYQSHTDKQVTMTSVQDQNDIIEVQFSGSAPVFLGADTDSKISVLPCITISNSDEIENVMLRDSSKKLEHKRSTLEVKVGQKPIWYESTTIISCKSPRDLPSISMVQSLSRLIDPRNNEIFSEACGQPFDIINFVPFINTDDMASGLHRKDITFTLAGKYWNGLSTVKKAVEKVIVGVGDTKSKLESVND